MKNGMNGKRYRNLYKSMTKIDPYTGKETRGFKYTGKYYRLTAEKRLVNAVCRRMLLCVCLFWIGFIAGGFINAPGSHSVWVLPFFLFSVFPGFYAVMAVWHLFRLPAYITDPQKKGSLDSVKNSAWGIVILSALALVGSLVVFITRAASGRETEELIFFGFGILRLFAGWGMLREVSGLPYEEAIPPSN